MSLRVFLSFLYAISLTEVAFLPGVPVQAQAANRPNRLITPGEIWCTELEKVCHTRTCFRRKTTPTMKRQAYQDYGIDDPGRGEYQIDHLVPLCLGGEDSQSNIWPQSYSNRDYGPKEKDHLERLICRKICDKHDDFDPEEKERRAVNLLDYQRRIRDDWVRLYREEVKNQWSSDTGPTCDPNEPYDDCSCPEDEPDRP